MCYRLNNIFSSEYDEIKFYVDIFFYLIDIIYIASQFHLIIHTILYIVKKFSEKYTPSLINITYLS